MTGSSAASSSGHIRTGRPDLNSNCSTIFSDWPSCELTGTSDRSFSRAYSAKFDAISAVGHRISFRSLRRPNRTAARSNAFNKPCASVTLRTASVAALLSRSDEITFGRTGISSSIASALILAPKSPDTATHFSIAAIAAALGSPTSGRKTSLIGIALSCGVNVRAFPVTGLDLRQATESAGNRFKRHQRAGGADRKPITALGIDVEGGQNCRARPPYGPTGGHFLGPSIWRCYGCDVAGGS